MDEHQVGITEYTTATAGFTGILKHRYEDFQVFEVDNAGRTAHLNTTSPPEVAEPVPDAQLTEASIAELVKAFKNIAGQENAERWNTFLNNTHKFQQQQQQQQGKEQPVQAGALPQAAAAVDGAASALEAAAAGRGLAGAEQQQQQLDAAAFEMFLLPIHNKQTRKEVHCFLKTDPRLPPLETDTVAAGSGPEAAEAAAAGAAIAAAARTAANQEREAGPNMQLASEDIAADKQKEAEALTIIRVRLCSNDAGRARKRGAPKQQQDAQDRRRGGNKRGRDGWKGSDWVGGDNKFTKFVLLKENMDTQAALTVVGRMLRLHSHSFGFAGTKDRRGITTQYVTLFKVDPKRLSALNPRLRGIKLGNFEFSNSQLQLGQLRGNAFRILMRDVTPQDEQHIASAVAEVRHRGFINYFGLQRFGTGSVPTHRVGAALLRGEWKAAVELILQGTAQEKADIRKARELYTQQGDIKGALDAMPTWMVAERAILSALLKQGPNSYVSGLQAVPRTLRSMYMHAWQSWCWNSAASERIRSYGADSVVAGDLVLPPSAAADADCAAEAVEAADLAAEAAEGAAAASTREGDTDPSEVKSCSAAARLAAVHVVTAEEAEQGTYSIRDVVLPLPGGQVQYPQHAAGWELYCKLAAADDILLPGMTDAEFAAAKAAATATAAAPTAAGISNGAAGSAAGTAVPRQHGVQDFQLCGLSGDYRKVLHVPSGMQHRLVRYTNPNQPDLLPTDLTELLAHDEQRQQQQQQSKRPKLEPRQQQGSAQAGADEQEPEQQQRDQGKQLGEQQQGAALQGAQDAPLTAEDAMEVDKEQQGSQGPAAAAAAAAASNGSAAPGVVAAELTASAADDDEAQAAGGVDGDSNQQARVGVILEFTLPSSCYATMLIRELTKTSTSKAAHKQLSAKQPAGAAV